MSDGKRKRLRDWMPVIMGVVTLIVVGSTFWLTLVGHSASPATLKIQCARLNHAAAGMGWKVRRNGDDGWWCVSWKQEGYYVIGCSNWLSDAVTEAIKHRDEYIASKPNADVICEENGNQP